MENALWFENSIKHAAIACIFYIDLEFTTCKSIKTTELLFSKIKEERRGGKKEKKIKGLKDVIGKQSRAHQQFKWKGEGTTAFEKHQMGTLVIKCN